MRISFFSAAVLLILCSCSDVTKDPAKARPNEAANLDLYHRFSSRYVMVEGAFVGVLDNADFRSQLTRAHQNVLRALQANDEPSFRAALLEFMNANRSLAFRGATTVDSLSQGQGGGGSSTIAASGANTGMSIAAARAHRQANLNDVTCAYFFGEVGNSLETPGYRNCTLERMDRIHASLVDGSARMASIRSAMNER
jgi:hypothetical protein